MRGRLRSSAPLLALVCVTAVWGVTFVQVQDALALYPLFAFLAVRFAISTVVLAPFAWKPLRELPRAGFVAGAGVGVLLALAYGLQTAGLELTTVTSTGFITGLYVVFTPLIALVLFRTPVAAALWVGIALSVAGLLLLSGMPGGSALGNALVLGNAVAQSFQIASMERFAPRYDPRALTFLQMATSFVGFTVIALALGDLEVPHGWTVWGALLVTGVFAGRARLPRRHLGAGQDNRRARGAGLHARGPVRCAVRRAARERGARLGGLARLRRDAHRHHPRRARCSPRAAQDGARPRLGWRVMPVLR